MPKYTVLGSDWLGLRVTVAAVGAPAVKESITVEGETA
jgi:hypothetical protein